MKLQVNANGAWKHILDFKAEQHHEVVSALVPLARVLGTTARWSVLHADGHREWLGTLTDASAEAKAEQFAREAGASGV